MLHILNAVELRDGQVVTSSLLVSEHFEKLHKNVLRDIENLEASAEFIQLNFEPYSYRASNGKENPAFYITRDGFSFLAMGFTGKRAAEFKEAYIKAFNSMEAKLQKVALQNVRIQTWEDIAKFHVIQNKDKLGKYVQQFPPEFFRAAYHVLGWNYQPNKSQNPSYMGKFIIKTCYQTLPPGCWKLINEANPRLEGDRDNYCHQYLTDAGQAALKARINWIIEEVYAMPKSQCDKEHLYAACERYIVNRYGKEALVLETANPYEVEGQLKLFETGRSN